MMGNKERYYHRIAAKILRKAAAIVCAREPASTRTSHFGPSPRL